MVQIQSIKYSDQKKVDLKMGNFGTNYQVLIDNAMYLIFLNKNLSGTGFEIIKIHKQPNFFERVFIKGEDFGIQNIFINQFAAFYNSENNILSLILVNSLHHSLSIYTAFFLPNEMNLQKIKTINDSFDLFPLDPTITGISCSPFV
jgi:hypothetical protein